MKDAFGEELKVGDEVLVSKLHGTAAQLFVRGRVTKLTAKQIHYTGTSAVHKQWEYYNDEDGRFRSRTIEGTAEITSHTISDRCVKL